MPKVLRRTARAILVRNGDLILIKRTRPGRAPYWVTVGGGVEPQDASVEAALHREVFEEIGGTVTDAQQVYVLSEAEGQGINVHHFFIATLATMDLDKRTGTEFAKPERGEYEVDAIPFGRQSLCSIHLMPGELADYLTANVAGLTTLVAGRPPADAVADRSPASP